MGFTDIEPIFVVGAPRSGTTLLQLILNAHPDVAIHGEIHFFDAILQLKAEIPAFEDQENLRSFFEQLGRANALRYIPGFEQRLMTVQKRLEQSASPSYELFFRLLMEVFAEESGAGRCGEKTPQNIRYLPELVEVFPRAKIVHIVRDPRDVVASLLTMPWAPDSVLLNSLKWKIDMLYMRDFLQTGGMVHEFHYEDLVAEPEPTLHALCHFIGIDWHPAMLEFNRSADTQIQDEPWKSGTRRELNASAVAGWKKKLGPSEARVIQIFSSPFLEHYGYTSEPGSMTELLSLPWRLGVDVARYLAHRRTAGAAEQNEDPGLIVGEESRLRAKMREAILRRRI